MHRVYGGLGWFLLIFGIIWSPGNPRLALVRPLKKKIFAGRTARTSSTASWVLVSAESANVVLNVAVLQPGRGSLHQPDTPLHWRNHGWDGCWDQSKILFCLLKETSWDNILPDFRNLVDSIRFYLITPLPKLPLYDEYGELFVLDYVHYSVYRMKAGSKISCCLNK